MSAKKTVNAVSFEEAMAELEKIVSSLERGEGTLDESIVLFTRGMELTGLCNDILKKIEGKITKLTAVPSANTSPDGLSQESMIEAPFELAD